MSIVLGNNYSDSNYVSNGVMRRSKISPFNSSPVLELGDRTVEDGDDKVQSWSSSSSSIGVNSDDENDKQIDIKNEENEVESKFKITPFDSAVDALEQALPLSRRGISKFYNGKSKSFASLTDAVSSSIREITKPENAYSRKRKNLLAYNLLYDKGRTSLLKTHSIGGGIAKRPTNSSRSTLALAVAMNNHEMSINENGHSVGMNGRSNTGMPPISPRLSSLASHPWRSFSVVDLQHCAVSASVVKCNLSSPLVGKRTNSDEVS